MAIYWHWSYASPKFLIGTIEGRKIRDWRSKDIHWFVGLAVIAGFPSLYTLFSEDFLGALIMLAVHSIIIGMLLYLLKFPHLAWRLDVARALFFVWAVIFVPAGMIGL